MMYIVMMVVITTGALEVLGSSARNRVGSLVARVWFSVSTLGISMMVLAAGGV